MYELRLLGGINLTDPDGTEVRAVLAQPKRLALLAYLTVAPFRLLRDTVIAMFWPDSETARARASLRRSLSYLRGALGAEVLSGDNEDRIGVSRDGIWCDVLAFRSAIRAGDHIQALELYRGDLMAGLFISDAPEFDMWLDVQRYELRALASRSALVLSRTELAKRDVEAAIRWARRGWMLAPESESVVQWLLTLYDHAGDRGAAARTYRDFESRLSRMYGLEPSPETRSLMNEITRRLRPTAGSDRDGLRELAPPDPGAGKFQRFVASATDAIYTIDRRRRIVYANAATARLAGRNIAEVPGLDFLELVHPDFRPTVAGLWAQHLAEEDAASWYLEFPCASGGEEVAWYGQSMQHIRGPIEMVQAVARDVTERLQEPGSVMIPPMRPVASRP